MPQFFQPDPKSKTIVDSTGKPLTFEQYKAAGGAAASANVKFPDVVVGAPPSGSTTTNPGTETTPGSLTPASSGSKLANIQLALRDALNEAGRTRAQNDAQAISPLAEGAAPGSMSQIVNLIRGSVQSPVENTFNTIVTAQQKEADQALAAKKNAMDTLSTLSDSGALLTMPDSALLVMEKNAGLPEGTALAWKARLTIATKHSDEKAAAELKLIQSQIAENYAQAKAAGGGTGNASTGFTSSKVETDARQDAASLLDNVAAKAMSIDDAYKRLRLLYSPKEASDEALRGLLGIQPPKVETTPPVTVNKTGTDNSKITVKQDNGQLKMPYTYQAPDVSKFINNLSSSLFGKK